MRPEPKAYRLNNMLGGINSMSAKSALLSFGKDVKAEAEDIENFVPTVRGGQKKEPGLTLYKDLGTGEPVTGIYKFTDGAALTHFLASSEDTLYEVNEDLTLDTISTDLEPGAYLDFETAYGLCVICDGVTAHKWDGTTFGALGGSPPAGARQSLFYADSLLIFSESADRNLIFYSEAGDVEEGYSDNFIECDVDNGNHITHISKFFIPGDLTPLIIVGKTRQVGVVSGDGTVTDPFTFLPVSSDVGVMSFRSVGQFGQDVAYLTAQGVSSYRTNVQNVNMNYEDLTLKVKNKFLALNQSVLSASICVHDFFNSRLRFFVPEAGKPLPNVVWNWDTRYECWYKSRYPWSITAAFVDSDGTQYLGTENGEIYTVDPSASDYGGAPINAFYKTGFMDFGQPNIKKQVADARITMLGNGSYGVGIRPSYDYGVRSGPTVTVNLTQASYTWGGGVWTDDPRVYQWGGSNINIKRFIPAGYFNSMQLQISNSGANQPIEIEEIEFRIHFGRFI